MLDSLLPLVRVRLASVWVLWGNTSVAAGTGKRYMSPGLSDSTASTGPSGTLPTSRNGHLRKFTIRHNTASGNGNDVVYDIEVNGIPQGLGLTLATGAIDSTGDDVTKIFLLAGDLIDVTASKAAAIGGGGSVKAIFTCEFI